MRCGCAFCGAFMVQEEKESGCICPECGYVCRACMGAGQKIEKGGNLPIDLLLKYETDPKDSES